MMVKEVILILCISASQKVVNSFQVVGLSSNYLVAPSRPVTAEGRLVVQSSLDDDITPSDVDVDVDDEVVTTTATAEEKDEKRSKLKRDLLTLAASYDRGFGASSTARQRGEDLIQELEQFNEETEASKGINGGDDDGGGASSSSSSSPLEGSWRMIWTTASDVLVLGASPVATVGAIYQIFEPPVVTNVIDFIPKVQALLPPNLVPSTLVRAKVRTRSSTRTGYPNRVGLVFEAVKLQPIQVLGVDATKLPPFATNLPKIPGTDNDSGPGYFDVTYLDDELLIIRQNAPGGLFALVKVPDSEP